MYYRALVTDTHTINSHIVNSSLSDVMSAQDGLAGIAGSSSMTVLISRTRSGLRPAAAVENGTPLVVTSSTTSPELVSTVLRLRTSFQQMPGGIL